MKQLSTSSRFAPLFILLMGLCSSNLLAQDANYVQGDLLIQLKPGTEGEKWLQSWNRLQPDWLHLDKIEQISRPADIWLVKFDPSQTEDRSILRAVQQSPKVLIAQRNHKVEMRGVPSDLQFDQQWQYQNTGQSGGTVDADIDAVEAWDITTGGTTLAGDTIVVAVLDDGVDIDHPDFLRNCWRNYAEIPDNGIDDDMNGYVDDYAGWSIITDDDNLSGGGHGTPVAGIIGADGDNELGVTGVNWYVKVMNIKNNFNTNEAAVLEAYSYAWEQRIAYNESGGERGAFVVSTNASWGIDGGDPEDAPLWCDFYDVMGQDGIISCGATANANFDIDEVGDLPTACPSDYLIAVTNTNDDDVKVTQAGFGVTTIDLGAPGAGAYNLANGGGYAGFGGTSGATPHVAGAIALLYSLDCPTLVALIESDPGAAGLLVREAILEGVDPNESLADITVTGGRLNVNNSLQYLLQFCDGCIPATSIRTTDIGVDVATIQWNTNDSLQSVDLRWRAVDAMDWDTIVGATSPLALTTLSACTEYEYQVQSICANDTIAFGESRLFLTDGCCTAPEEVMFEVLSGSSVNFTWNAVTAAQSYDLRYRVDGTTDWVTVSPIANSVQVDDLESCTFYQYQLRTNCLDESTEWTDIGNFLTSECGPCLDLEYCQPTDVLSTDEEWIAEIGIGGFFTNTSEGAPNGYNDFGQTAAPVDLEAGLTYPIQLTPGFVAGSLLESWRIWLDSDHNGSFTSNEIILDVSATSNAVNDFITIPAAANLGVTRMRIMMRFSSPSDACTFISNFGEIEDYCINVLPAADCPEPSDFVVTPLNFNAVEVSWSPVPQALDYDADYRGADDVEWTSATVMGSMISLSDLDSCVNYTLRVRTLCNGNESDFTLFEFDTCTDPNSIEDLLIRRAWWQVNPNPFDSQFEIRIGGEVPTDDLSVIVYNSQGQALIQSKWRMGRRSLRIQNASSLPSGLYTVALFSEGKIWSSRRIIKQ
ncbi:MAG: S8 family serine peptidase [Bacteroidota bacterium]